MVNGGFRPDRHSDWYELLWAHRRRAKLEGILLGVPRIQSYVEASEEEDVSGWLHTAKTFDTGAKPSRVLTRTKGTAF